MIPWREFRTARFQHHTFDQMHFKASHNSYEFDETLSEQLRFDVSDPAELGCRGLELDLHQNAGGFEWSVKHDSWDADLDFRTFLDELLAWSDARSRHDVVLVTLDLKHVDDDVADFPNHFDDFLEDAFDPHRLVRPGTVVFDGARQWPTMVELRDRFVFCLSGDEEYKWLYSRFPDRLCFADWALGPATLPEADLANDPRIFINCNGGHWVNRSLGPRLPPGYVTRVWGVGTPEQWTHFQALGFNVLATDHIDSWWGTFGSGTAFEPRPSSNP